METWKPLRDFIIVTTPVVLVYITGWTYLSSYLNFFHISPSGVKIDVPTVFVYSYGPLYGIFRTHYLLITFAIVAFIIAIQTNIFSRPISAIGRWNNKRNWFRALPSPDSFVWLVYFLILTVSVLTVLVNFVVVPSAEASANQDAHERWMGTSKEGVLINTTQEHPGSSASLSKTLEDFNKCQERGPLLPIFSDENSLFLLCKSSVVPDYYGTIFEIKKDKGVFSSELVVLGDSQ